MNQQTIFETRGAKTFGNEFNGMNEDHLNVHDLVSGANANHDHSHHSKISSDIKSKACRVRGSIKVGKVSGLFHVTALGHGYFGFHLPHEGT